MYGDIKTELEIYIVYTFQVPFDRYNLEHHLYSIITITILYYYYFHYYYYYYHIVITLHYYSILVHISPTCCVIYAK